jgi:hypothetical protein
VGRFLCGAALLCSLGSGGGASGYGLPSWTNDEGKIGDFLERDLVGTKVEEHVARRPVP